MDECSRRAGEYVGGDEIQAITGRAAPQHRGDFGGFSITLKHRFGRSNPPFSMNYAAGDIYQQYYSLTPELAAIWTEVRGLAEPSIEVVHADEA